jgi:NAD(P)-dependent dehydrogenase (short-subunit alcohol dehydrogenase family)
MTAPDPHHLLDAAYVERVLKSDCLRGRRALVTGARFCSIGSATALALHAAGAEIVVHAESDEVLDPTCRFLDHEDVSYRRFVADFSDPSAAEALGHRVLDEAGPIDILVNVAGVTLPTPIEDVTVEEIQRILAINTTSAVMLTKTLLPPMVERGRGNIVLFSSVAARQVLPGHYFIYAMTKAAMEPLAQYLAVTYGKRGIAAHVVVPGIVDNERHRSDPELFAAITRTTDEQPAGYMARPIEIGANVALLCTELGTYANGSAVVLDGGRSKVF